MSTSAQQNTPVDSAALSEELQKLDMSAAAAVASTTAFTNALDSNSASPRLPHSRNSISSISTPPDSPVMKVGPGALIDTKSVLNCKRCNTKFGVTTRKHHCRACGNVFCAMCVCKKYHLGEAHGYPNDKTKKHRLCAACYCNVVLIDYEQNPGTFPPMPDYDEVEMEMSAAAFEMSQTPASKWTMKTNKNGASISVMNVEGSPLYAVKSVCTIKAPLLKCFQMYRDISLWRHWQPDLHECTTISRPRSHSEVLYVAYKLPVVDNRDSSMYSVVKDGLFEDPTQPAKRIMAKSVVHPLLPGVSGWVRADLHVSLTVFEQEAPGVTKFTSYVHADPKGMIPSKLTNQMVSRTTDQILFMATYMAKSDYKYQEEP